MGGLKGLCVAYKKAQGKELSWSGEPSVLPGGPFVA